jgi:hypothetical protein
MPATPPTTTIFPDFLSVSGRFIKENVELMKAPRRTVDFVE